MEIFEAGSARLVLWDIDQTLIDGGAVMQGAYAAAFHRATGRTLLHPWRFDGRTELAAATEALVEHGLPAEGALLQAFLEAIVAELRAGAGDLAAAGRALPGAREALSALGGVIGVTQSVLTGNLFPLAVLKLDLFGLTGHLDLRIGAYGGDAADRSDLPRFALDRALTHLRRQFSGREVVIIGDTPRDVAAALAIGARAVCVATGTTGAADLYAAGADVVLPDLTDTESVLRAITSLGPRHAGRSRT